MSNGVSKKVPSPNATLRKANQAAYAPKDTKATPHSNNSRPRNVTAENLKGADRT